MGKDKRDKAKDADKKDQKGKMDERGKALPGDPDKLPYRKGVGALVFNQQGLVLVGRRIDTAEEAWQLPQGGVDDDEKPRQALLRELTEEIGTDKFEILAKAPRWFTYDVPEAMRGKLWGGGFRGQKQRWFAVRFTGEDSDIDLAASDDPEFNEWRWVRIETLPHFAVSFKRPLYEELATEFRPIADRLAAAFADPKAGAKDGGRP